MSYYCVDAADSLTVEFCKSERKSPANGCYLANQHSRAEFKQKRLYPDMGGDDSSLSTECFFLKDAPRKPSLKCSTNNQTIFPFSRWPSDSVASLDLQLDFISEGVHQLDSADSDAPLDDFLGTTLTTRALEEELEEKKLLVTGTETRTSSSLLSASPLKFHEAHHGSNDTTTHIKLMDHQMPTNAHCSSYASLEFQLQYVAPNDPLGTSSVAPFVVFPNMHDPVFTTASFLNTRQKETKDGLIGDFVGEEASKEGYGWFVELDQDVFEAQKGLLSFAKNNISSPLPNKAAPQVYGVARAG